MSASAPQAAGSMGTVRQPAGSRPARTSCAASVARAAAACCGSRERNTSPEAKRAVSVMPHSAATARRNPSGRFSSSPQPSPVLPSVGDGAAVGQAVQRGDGGAHQPVARRVVEAGDQAKAAAVALVSVLVESAGRGMHGDGLDDARVQPACARRRTLRPQLASHRQFMRSGDPSGPLVKGCGRAVGAGRERCGVGRLSYTITMRSIIPACEAVASA